MKRLLHFALLIFLTAALVACGDKKANNEEAGGKEDTTAQANGNEQPAEKRSYESAQAFRDAMVQLQGDLLTASGAITDPLFVDKDAEAARKKLNALQAKAEAAIQNLKNTEPYEGGQNMLLSLKVMAEFYTNKYFDIYSNAITEVDKNGEVSAETREEMQKLDERFRKINEQFVSALTAFDEQHGTSGPNDV